MLIPDNVKQEIKLRIKNKLDISDLISNYDISGEDFTGAIITKFNQVGKNMSGLILTDATIGLDGTETHLSRANAKNCTFKRTKFLGTVIAKKTDFSNTDFSNAFIPYCDYRLADLRGCSFCGTIFTIHTHYALGAKYDTAFFKDLAAHWNVKVITNEEYNKLKEYEALYLKDNSK